MAVSVAVGVGGMSIAVAVGGATVTVKVGGTAVAAGVGGTDVDDRDVGDADVDVRSDTLWLVTSDANIDDSTVGATTVGGLGVGGGGAGVSGSVVIVGCSGALIADSGAGVTVAMSMITTGVSIGVGSARFAAWAVPEMSAFSFWLSAAVVACSDGRVSTGEESLCQSSAAWIPIVVISNKIATAPITMITFLLCIYYFRFSQ